MTAPTSLPVTPAAPSFPAAIAALNLFVTWTRATFLAAFGCQAPPYNPSQPTRNWFDTSATPGPYEYALVNGPTASILALPVPANVGLPNLPGIYQYPAWSNPATTVAVVQLPGVAGTQPLNPQFLVSMADAEAVLAALPAGSEISEDSTDANVIWGAETRRDYTVNVPGGPAGQYVQPLRAAMTHISTDTSGNYASGGIGSPGSFLVSAAAINWAPAPDPGLSAGPAMAVPCAPLWPNTAFGVGPLASVEIVSTAVASTGGGLTADQASAIAQIPGMASILTQLATRFGITA